MNTCQFVQCGRLMVGGPSWGVRRLADRTADIKNIICRYLGFEDIIFMQHAVYPVACYLRVKCMQRADSKA